MNHSKQRPTIKSEVPLVSHLAGKETLRGEKDANQVNCRIEVIIKSVIYVDSSES